MPYSKCLPSLDDLLRPEKVVPFNFNISIGLFIRSCLINMLCEPLWGSSEGGPWRRGFWGWSGSMWRGWFGCVSSFVCGFREKRAIWL